MNKEKKGYEGVKRDQLSTLYLEIKLQCFSSKNSFDIYTFKGERSSDSTAEGATVPGVIIPEA